jgi:hypothetical protein
MDGVVPGYEYADLSDFIEKEEFVCSLVLGKERGMAFGFRTHSDY